MKYIVFSFDDGLHDFQDNALPILKKFGFKATINVISGFSDLSVPSEYNYLSIDEIRDLYGDGFEIANHTNSHAKHGSYTELLLCNEKINSWLGTQKIFGIAMPKYAKPNDSAIQYIKEKNAPYVTYEVQKVITLRNIFRRLRWKIIFYIKKDPVSLMCYSTQRKAYKKGHAKEFRRIEVGHETNMDLLSNALKTIKDGWCVTLCFHSIVDDVNSSSYPKGSCTLRQFESLCNLISHNPDFCVTTQIELCKR